MSYQEHHIRGNEEIIDHDTLILARKNKQRHDNLYNEPGFHWSLDKRNKEFADQYAVNALTKIQAAATKLKLKIHQEDLDWLQKFPGRAMAFIPPGSDSGKAYISQARKKKT